MNISVQFLNFCQSCTVHFPKNFSFLANITSSLSSPTPIVPF